MRLLRHALPCIAVLALVGCTTADQPPKLPGRVDAPPPPMVAPGDALLTDATWAWQGTRLKDGSRVVPDSPERYTLVFRPGGTVDVRADCNRGSATYVLNDTSLKLGPIGLTKMMCGSGSRDTEFLKELAAVTTQDFEGYDLLLITGDAATMRFTTRRQ